MLKKYLGIVAIFVILMMTAPLFALINAPERDNFPKKVEEEKIILQNHETNEISEITVKDYIKGVVAANIPAEYETEAIKAQALASYTYMLRQISSMESISEQDDAVLDDEKLESEKTETDNSENIQTQEDTDETIDVTSENSNTNAVDTTSENSNTNVADSSDESAGNQTSTVILTTDPSKFQAYADENELKSKYGDKYDEYTKKISDAVDSVWGKYISHDGQPIAAAFFAFSNGKTESAVNVWGQKVPYLVAVDSEKDKEVANFEITVSIPSEEVLARLQELEPEISMPIYNADWFKIAERSDSGYVTKIAVGDKTLSGSQIRTIYNLKSTDFEIEAEDDQFLFTTKGNGHGVGMSQNGANEMAKEGKNYEEIIKYYFTEVEII